MIGGSVPAGIAGMADVSARVAAIQARISSVTGAASASGVVPSFQLPAEAAATTPRSPAAPAGGAGGFTTASTAATSDGGSGPTAPPGPWAAGLPPAGRAWAPAIQAAADAAGVDASLLAAVVQHESGFDPDARSHAGAVGLAQLMPGTAESLGVDPTDPSQNLAGGARYLRAQLDRFGSVDLALAAYNAGPTRVAEAGGVPRLPETLAYVDRVTATWEELR